MKDKKGQSQIVTAVLLILIVIALAVLILNFSTNFVKDKLEGTGCFEAVGQVTFTNSPKYTCFRDTDPLSTADHLLLQVHLGDFDDEIAGFLIETGGADTQSIEIRPDGTATGVTMFDGTTTLQLPGKNEERTYIISAATSPDSVKIYPILIDEQVCEASDVLESVGLCK
jgi:flagellin-like protein